MTENQNPSLDTEDTEGHIYKIRADAERDETDDTELRGNANAEPDEDEDTEGNVTRMTD